MNNRVTGNFKLFETTFILMVLFNINYSCHGQKSKIDTRLNPPREMTVETIYKSKESLFLPARSAIIPHGPDTGFLITQSIHGYGIHSYGDLYQMRKESRKGQWSRPYKIGELEKLFILNDLIRSFGDVTPDWHQNTQTILCTGKSFFSEAQNTKLPENKNKRADIEHMQEIAYAAYYPYKSSWSQLKKIELPEKLDNGDDFVEANAGCTQRVDLPIGDILLPIRYKRNGYYVSTVIKCSYDGKILNYKKHGSVLAIQEGRGLFEPSLCKYGGSFYLTMRANNSTYVAKSSDGL